MAPVIGQLRDECAGTVRAVEVRTRVVASETQAVHRRVVMLSLQLAPGDQVHRIAHFAAPARNETLQIAIGQKTTMAASTDQQTVFGDLDFIRIRAAAGAADVIEPALNIADDRGVLPCLYAAAEWISRIW